jgi:hypothetical protein
MTKFRDYLKGPEGKPSSTRLFSSYFMWYFFIINILVVCLVFLGQQAIDVNTIVFVSTHDVLILLAIFAPKQLGKISEIKGIIELAKSTATPDEETE